MKRKIISSLRQKKRSIESFSLSDRILEIEDGFKYLSFRSLYLFCFFWSSLCFLFFSVEMISTNNSKWSGLVYLGGFSILVYSVFLKFYSALINLPKTPALILVVASSWLLCLNQYFFVMASPYSHIAALHTVSGIPYALFIGLFYFLPTWQMTALSSLGPVFAIAYHYLHEVGVAWNFREVSGEINIFYISQIIVECGVFILIIAYLHRRKDLSGTLLREIFLKKIVAGPHIALMDSNIVAKRFGNWLISTKSYPSTNLVSSDVILIQKVDSEVYVIIGDCIGHGWDTSSGSFAICSAIRACLFAGVSVERTFHSIDYMLSRIDVSHGGEAFLQIFRLSPDGTAQIYGTAAGSTAINGVEIDCYSVLLGGGGYNEKMPFHNLCLFERDRIVSFTDGWKNSGDDDKTFVRIKYAPERK